eukprot:358045-Chlamydomonas_euryale.AAC.4
MAAASLDRVPDRLTPRSPAIALSAARRCKTVVEVWQLPPHLTGCRIHRRHGALPPLCPARKDACVVDKCGRHHLKAMVWAAAVTADAFAQLPGAVGSKRKDDAQRS